MEVRGDPPQVRRLLETPWLSINEALVVGEAGRSAWQYIDHPGSALVLPVTEDGRIVLARVWRVVIQRWSWEAPAGLLEPGEMPAVCAQRELSEEVGGRTFQMDSLGTVLPSVGSSNEITHLFLARDVRLAPPRPQPDELIEIGLFSQEQAVEFALDGVIDDSATIVAILRADKRGFLRHERR